jgi:hypothetical protein
MNTNGEIQVCKRFLSNVLQIDFKRLDTVQKKLLKSENLSNNSGKLINRGNKIQESVFNLIPKHKSHYVKENCDNIYFENFSLTLKEIYGEFKNIMKSIKLILN